MEALRGERLGPDFQNLPQSYPQKLCTTWNTLTRESLTHYSQKTDELPCVTQAKINCDEHGGGEGYPGDGKPAFGKNERRCHPADTLA